MATSRSISARMSMQRLASTTAEGGGLLVQFQLGKVTNIETEGIFAPLEDCGLLPNVGTPALIESLYLLHDDGCNPIREPFNLSVDFQNANNDLRIVDSDGKSIPSPHIFGAYASSGGDMRQIGADKTTYQDFSVTPLLDSDPELFGGHGFLIHHVDAATLDLTESRPILVSTLRNANFNVDHPVERHLHVNVKPSHESVLLPFQRGGTSSSPLSRLGGGIDFEAGSGTLAFSLLEKDSADPSIFADLLSNEDVATAVVDMDAEQVELLFRATGQDPVEQSCVPEGVPNSGGPQSPNFVSGDWYRADLSITPIDVKCVGLDTPIAGSLVQLRIDHLGQDQYQDPSVQSTVSVISKVIPGLDIKDDRRILVGLRPAVDAFQQAIATDFEIDRVLAYVPEPVSAVMAHCLVIGLAMVRSRRRTYLHRTQGHDGYRDRISESCQKSSRR